MAKIHAMMDIGKRSMMNSQTSLQTTAHNIANKTTEGFSRQRVDVVTAQPVGEGRLQLGMGATPASVTRVINPAIDKQIQKESGHMGYLQGRSEMLERVQEVFNEQQNKGLNQYMTDFFNSFRELSNNPESLTTRTMVKDSAEALTNDFKRINKQLTDIERDVNTQVRVHCVEVNKMTKEIADLNKQIMEIEIRGNPANDQRDRRDLLLKKINDRVEISWAEGDHGMVNVSTAGNALLVSGLDSYDLQAISDPVLDKVDVYYSQREGNTPFKVSDRIKSGQLGGALTVRDKIIEDIRKNMDEMATTIAEEVNRAHVNGVDRQGRQGELFFDVEEPNSTKRISEMLILAKPIQNDVTRIAAGSHDKAPGDNTVAHVISNIQYKGILDNGTATLDDFYAAQVGQIGTFTQSAIKGRESQTNVLKQLNTIRDSVSGVSLDEEAVKMIEYQKAFDASARVIRTADEMFDTILNLKRM